MNRSLCSIKWYINEREKKIHSNFSLLAASCKERINTYFIHYERKMFTFLFYSAIIIEWRENSIYRWIFIQQRLTNAYFSFDEERKKNKNAYNVLSSIYMRVIFIHISCTKKAWSMTHDHKHTKNKIYEVIFRFVYKVTKGILRCARKSYKCDPWQPLKTYKWYLEIDRKKLKIIQPYSPSKVGIGARK